MYVHFTAPPRPAPAQTAPCLKKGGKVILFLRKARQVEPQVWITADMWFGVQPYNSVMEQSLKRLAEEKPPGPAVDD